MLVHPTIERLHALGLSAMADAFGELQNSSRDSSAASLLPLGRWHEVIGDPTLADAILDRIIHAAHRIELKGDSLRRRGAVKKPEPA
jgi:DNA replication protein DnaC